VVHNCSESTTFEEVERLLKGANAHDVAIFDNINQINPLVMEQVA